MEQAYRPHEAARVKSGKYAGLVGEVLENRPHTGIVWLHIAGVHNGETIDVKRWFLVKSLERVSK